MTVVVVGSVNADTTLTVDRLPGAGETVHARSVDRRGGGKGANVAYAAAAGDSTVVLVASVGTDADARLALSDLEAVGVSLAHVRRGTTATGTALILVDSAAENCIVVDPGANFAWSAEEAAAELESATRSGGVVVTNFEVPTGVCLAAARAAAAAGATFILNPSPPAPLSLEMVACHPLIVANTHEANALAAGLGTTTRHPQDAARVVSEVTGAPVVVTLGAEGAGVLERDWSVVPGQRLGAVDTTGAGDAFLGALAARLDTGCLLLDAVSAGVDYAARVVMATGARLPLSN